LEQRLQNAWHGSWFLPAQALLIPNGLSTAPVKAAPTHRSDCRRDSELSASDFENSSHGFVIGKDLS
jgi:hypothetical protein